MSDELERATAFSDMYGDLSTYLKDVSLLRKFNTNFGTYDLEDGAQAAKAADEISKAFVPLAGVFAMGAMSAGKFAKNSDEMYNEGKSAFTEPMEWFAKGIKWIADKEFKERIISDIEYAIDHGLEDSLNHIAKSIDEFDADEYFGEFRMVSTAEEIERRGRQRESASLKRGMYAYTKNGLSLSKTNEKILLNQYKENMMDDGFVMMDGYFDPKTMKSGFVHDDSLDVVSAKSIEADAQYKLSQGYQYSFTGDEKSTLSGLVTKLPINKDIKTLLDFGRDFQLHGMSDDVENRKKSIDNITKTMGVLTSLGVAGGVAVTVAANPGVFVAGTTLAAYAGTKKIVKPVVASISNFAKVVGVPEARERLKANVSHFINYELEDVLKDSYSKLKAKAEDAKTRLKENPKASGRIKLMRSPEEYAERKSAKTEKKNTKRLSRAVHAKSTRGVSFTEDEKKLYLAEQDKRMDGYIRTKVFHNPETKETRYYDEGTYKVYSAEEYSELLENKLKKAESKDTPKEDKPKGMGLRAPKPNRFNQDIQISDAPKPVKDYGPTWKERLGIHNLKEPEVVDSSKITVIIDNEELQL